MKCHLWYICSLAIYKSGRKIDLIFARPDRIKNMIGIKDPEQFHWNIFHHFLIQFQENMVALLKIQVSSAKKQAPFAKYQGYIF